MVAFRFSAQTNMAITVLPRAVGRITREFLFLTDSDMLFRYDLNSMQSFFINVWLKYRGPFCRVSVSTTFYKEMIYTVIITFKYSDRGNLKMTF